MKRSLLTTFLIVTFMSVFILSLYNEVPAATYKASGTYTYAQDTGFLTLKIKKSNFKCDGPKKGTEMFYVESVSETSFTWYNTELGIYSTNGEFEFQFEDGKIPQKTGTYTIKKNIQAIDFANNWTPYNLHAYKGSVIITSIDPLVGTFSFKKYAKDHKGKANLSGTVTGSFSVPFNEFGCGTFTAFGTVSRRSESYSININDSCAYSSVVAYDSESTIFTRSSGTAGNIAGTWYVTEGANNYTVVFNSDGTLTVTGTVPKCSK